MAYDERQNREDIIRGTISRQAHNLTPAEVDHAVKVAMELTDNGRNDMNWGQIADAGLAAVRTRRNSK